MKKAGVKTPAFFCLAALWRGQDSNLRPLGYEPNELPTAPPRDVGCKDSMVLFTVKHILRGIRKDFFHIWFNALFEISSSYLSNHESQHNSCVLS